MQAVAPYQELGSRFIDSAESGCEIRLAASLRTQIEPLFR